MPITAVKSNVTKMNYCMWLMWWTLVRPTEVTEAEKSDGWVRTEKNVNVS